jgi:hypothetical protein
MTTDRARLTLFAEGEFLRRQAKAEALIKAGQLTHEAANALLGPWAALAVRIGADLTPHVEGLADWLDFNRECEPHEGRARAWAADRLCPRDKAVAALVEARDKALDRDDWAAAAPLVWLAIHFLAPSYVPPVLRAGHARRPGAGLRRGRRLGRNRRRLPPHRSPDHPHQPRHRRDRRGAHHRERFRVKNKLPDLNNHLFAQLERLSEEGLTAEQIEQEVKRTDAIVAVADQIISNANLQLKAVKILADHGDRFKPHLTMIESKNAEG